MENKEKKGVNFDPLKFLRLCLKNWWAFAICLGACFCLAILYMVIRKPVMQVDAQLMLPPDVSNNSNLLFGDMASTFNITDMFGGNSTENEMAVMGSYSVFLKTAKDLNLNTGYYQKPGLIHWNPVYSTNQLSLTTLPSINDTLRGKLQFDIDLRNNGNFNIKVKRKGKTILKKKDVALPVTLDTDYGPFTIEKTEKFGTEECDRFRINFCSYSTAAQNYAKIVTIFTPNKKADLIALSYLTPVPAFGEKLLNTIIDNYNLMGDRQRNERDNRTMEFLNIRLEEIGAQLAVSEQDVINFKKTHDLTDLEYNATTLLTKNTEFENAVFSMETDLEVLDVARKFLANPENDYSLLPAFPSGGEAIGTYNSLIMDRMRLLNSAKPNNTVLKNIDKQIDALRENIKANMERVYRNTKLRLSEIDKERNKVKGYVDSIPTIQREYAWIQRQYNLQRQLYMFLVKQREETAMSLAKVSPTLVTVDPPYTLAIAPGLSNTMIFFLAIFFGGILGLIWIFYLILPHAKLEDLKTLKSESTTPILGKIQIESSNPSIVVNEVGKGESIRMLRSEVEFILNGCQGKSMLVTSVDNEADSAYVAANLAATFAMQGSKTLIVDADLRNNYISAAFDIKDPKTGIHSMINHPSKNSAFLSTVSFGDKELWVLPAGSCIGNPSDVIASPEFATMLDSFKEDFSYIIINCPQLKGFSDTYSIASSSDLTLIDIDLAKDTPDDVAFVNNLTTSGRLPRIAIIASIKG